MHDNADRGLEQIADTLRRWAREMDAGLFMDAELSTYAPALPHGSEKGWRIYRPSGIKVLHLILIRREFEESKGA